MCKSLFVPKGFNTPPFRVRYVDWTYLKGNSISTEYQGVEVEMEFEINGDTLTVDIMGFGIEFERISGR
jgi:hypothetical protein